MFVSKHKIISARKASIKHRRRLLSRFLKRTVKFKQRERVQTAHVVNNMTRRSMKKQLSSDQSR